jgi:hypothetical protein
LSWGRMKRIAERYLPHPLIGPVFWRLDLYFGAVVKKGGLGKFEHNREALPIDKQTVIRTNRDTLMSRHRATPGLELDLMPGIFLRDGPEIQHAFPGGIDRDSDGRGIVSNG